MPLENIAELKERVNTLMNERNLGRFNTGYISGHSGIELETKNLEDEDLTGLCTLAAEYECKIHIAHQPAFMMIKIYSKTDDPDGR